MYLRYCCVLTSFHQRINFGWLATGSFFFFFTWPGPSGSVSEFLGLHPSLNKSRTGQLGGHAGNFPWYPVFRGPRGHYYYVLLLDDGCSFSIYIHYLILFFILFFNNTPYGVQRTAYPKPLYGVFLSYYYYHIFAFAPFLFFPSTPILLVRNHTLSLPSFHRLLFSEREWREESVSSNSPPTVWLFFLGDAVQIVRLARILFSSSSLHILSSSPSWYCRCFLFYFVPTTD